MTLHGFELVDFSHWSWTVHAKRIEYFRPCGSSKKVRAAPFGFAWWRSQFVLQILLGAEPSALNPRVSLPTSVAVLDFTLDTIDFQDTFHSAIWLLACGSWRDVYTGFTGWR